MQSKGLHTLNRMFNLYFKMLRVDIPKIYEGKIFEKWIMNLELGYEANA